MSRILHLALPLALASTLMLASLAAVADKVVCPVCGEELKEGSETCPNDGTNLKLLEKYKQKGEGAPEKSTAAKESSDTETAAEPDSEVAQPTPPEPPPSEPLLFKRHDKGGERQPAAAKESGGYSDRMSRIAGDRRHGSALKRLPPQPQKDDEGGSDQADKQLKSEFESRRDERWRLRGEALLAEARAHKSKEAKRRLLLDHIAAPITSLGARIFWMPEGHRQGPVGAAEIDVYLSRYLIRAGFSSLFGVRALSVRNELVLLQHVVVGMQLPRRFSPFVVARVGVGIMATQRFGEDQIYLMSALGADMGMDAWVNPWLSISPSLGYLRCTVNEAYWHSFTAKIAIGF